VVYKYSKAVLRGVEIASGIGSDGKRVVSQCMVGILNNWSLEGKNVSYHKMSLI
jgi:hypothetical protein